MVRRPALEPWLPVPVARGGLLVALNIATWPTDVAGVKPGGVIVHEAAYPRTPATTRSDVTYYPVPFAALAKEHVVDGSICST